MTTSAHAMRTFRTRNNELAREVQSHKGMGPTCRDVEDAYAAINAERPEMILIRMAGHLRLERHQWDRCSYTEPQRQRMAECLMRAIGFSDGQIITYVTKAMEDVRNG